MYVNAQNNFFFFKKREKLPASSYAISRTNILADLSMAFDRYIVIRLGQL